MKNLYFIALVAAGLLCASGANAANSIWILGKQYTADADIFGDGTVRYVESTHSLYLNNANISNKSTEELTDPDIIPNSKYSLIYTDNTSTSKTLTIYLKGDNTLKSHDDIERTTTIGIKNSSTTINYTLNILKDPDATSTPSLTIVSNSRGINVDSNAQLGVLNFDHCGDITIDAGYEGIEVSGKLTFNSVNAKIKGSYAALWSYSEPTYTDCSLSSTEDMSYDSKYRYYMDADSHLINEITIERELDIWLGYNRMGNYIIDNQHSSIISGSIGYYSDTRVLLLDNLHIENEYLIVKEPGVTIQVKGDCRFDNAYWELDTDSITITGNGTLTIENSNGANALFAYNNTKLTIDGPTINLKSQEEALYSDLYTGEIVVRNSNMTLESTTAAAMDRVISLVLVGCFILTPEDSEFSAIYSSIVDWYGNRAKKVEIVKGQLYGFTIGGKKVHSADAADIMGDGKISYNANNNTLTLKDVESNYLINNTSQEGLKITAAGDSSTVGRVIAYVNTTFSGNKLMRIINEQTATNAIEVYPSDEHKEITVSMNNANVKVISKYNSAIKGITTDTDQKVILNVNNADVVLNGKTSAATDIDEFTLKNGKINAPKGAKFDGDLSTFTYMDEDVSKTVTELVIKGGVEYSLWVSGKQVTSRNANSLAEGVSFDAENNILTLEEAELSSSSSYGAIRSKLEALTIALKGKSTIESSYDAIQVNYGTVTIQPAEGSKGSVTITTDEADAAIMLSDETALNITAGVSVKVKNTYQGYGIAAEDDASASVNINNANLTVSGKKGSIGRLAALKLTGAQIVEPVGAEFVKNKGVCTLEDGSYVIVKEPVVIEATSTGIGQLTGEEQNGIQKLLTPDGQIRIIRNGKAYNVLGNRIQ